ncbi:MAG: oxygen-independent coproporphyrinogen III oxidase [Mariprofundaceae bacterium]|nr:oxygen-independent coproporphyrinogen III oxidase [Mariprofundaceae bacterium]
MTTQRHKTQTAAGDRPVFDLPLIHKYDKAGPRYTSYPTAPMFHDGFQGAQYIQALQNASKKDAPLSLYVHIPFCNTVCYYCGCNKIVTKRYERAAPYVARLKKEIAMIAAHIGKERQVSQVHWGGGTPTFLNDAQILDLSACLHEHFDILDGEAVEFSIEIDPRECGSETISTLRKAGFNRMSMGVQDFDPCVQKAVNRIQSYDETLKVLTEARAAGFASMNIDLMYGLPLQTVESFDRTLSTIIEFSPDRIALFNYAHLPHMFMPQRRINEDDIPTPQTKLNILEHSISRLLDAGYVFIGMDHFAKPEDELSVAQAKGLLYRNFQGYSTHADADMVGIGVSSIGYIDGAFFQNEKEIDTYDQAIDDHQFATMRGYRLTNEDHLRRVVIMRLMCDFSLNFQRIAKQFSLNFSEHFSQEILDLQKMHEDGLLVLTLDSLVVQPAGRLLIRNIAMVFDEHLKKKQSSFSKVI